MSLGGGGSVGCPIAGDLKAQVLRSAATQGTNTPISKGAKPPLSKVPKAERGSVRANMGIVEKKGSRSGASSQNRNASDLFTGEGNAFLVFGAANTVYKMDLRQGPRVKMLQSLGQDESVMNENEKARRKHMRALNNLSDALNKENNSSLVN